MKYAAFWEFSPDVYDALLAKNFKMMEERKKGTEKYVKILFEPHYLGTSNKGLTIVEGDEDQLENWVLFYYPEVAMKIVPLLETARMIKKFQELK